jgi:hypothetical protein
VVTLEELVLGEDLAAVVVTVELPEEVEDDRSTSPTFVPNHQAMTLTWLQDLTLT